jgi:hypothetical protein
MIFQILAAVAAGANNYKTEAWAETNSFGSAALFSIE